MKELIKPNIIEDSYEKININCSEDNPDICAVVECPCRNSGKGSIDNDDEILF